MLAMLLRGGPNLPDALPVLSPWVDADLGVSVDEVTTALYRQHGRRVVKTHTPADGFPIWKGVTVIAVYRHPLDIFFSLRKHNANMSVVENDEPMRWPLPQAFEYFVNADADPEDFDRDKLATVTRHYTETVLSGRNPEMKLFHYSDLVHDGIGAARRMAEAVGVIADRHLIERVANASSFNSMKANAADYAPVGGTGFWKSDSNFFDSATSGKWCGVLSEADLQMYTARLEELVPDAAARDWLEYGDASISQPSENGT